MDHASLLLIAGADLDFTTILHARLSGEGYSCHTADTIDTALALTRQWRFDAILTGMSLPGVPQAETLGRLKGAAPGVPLIVMVNDVETFAYDTVIESGAADFIIKPFSLKELKGRLKQILQQGKLSTITVTDQLTGLYNRTGFYTLVEQQLKLARRQKRCIYLLYADVDGLKAINDGWGRAEGDRALIDVGALLTGTYRGSDIIARVGGDEFVVIPIGSAGDDIPGIVRRLTHNVEQFNVAANRPYTLRVRVGTSFYDPANACSVDALLSGAEVSMYGDKKRKAARD